MDDPAFYRIFALAIKRIVKGYFPVIIHGGGKEISRQLDLLKKEVVFIEGLRVTDQESVNVVQMVLSGAINKRIVNALQSAGVNALGLSGVDAGLLTAEKMRVNGRDVGFVGKIRSVDTQVLELCKTGNIVPVISPVSRGRTGTIFNVNADVAACKIAAQLKAAHLLFVSDVRGVMCAGTVVKKLTPPAIARACKEGVITGGMIPKVRSAENAVKQGVTCVHICGWQAHKTFENELCKNKATGTVICSC
jgi:acetylglutamate kinase